ncbi:Lrp/AsnC family transcriptional regulator [Saccharopolyspora sp. NPDC002376]
MTSAFGQRSDDGASVPSLFPRGRYGKHRRSRAGDAPRASFRRVEAIDRGILQELRACTLTWFELLAQVSGVAASSVKRRIARLEASGVIRGHTQQIDRRALGRSCWPCPESWRCQEPPVTS